MCNVIVETFELFWLIQKPQNAQKRTPNLVKTVNLSNFYTLFVKFLIDFEV